MYLHERKNDKINIFEAKPNKERTIEYKKKEMESIPNKNRVLTAIGSKRNYTYPLVNKNNGDCVREKSLNVDSDEYYFHHLFPYLMTDSKRESVLEEYYNGLYDDGTVIKTSDDTFILKHLLLPEKYYTLKHGYPTLNNIINIPESLYLLQLLTQGDISNIDHYDNIDEQLETFDLLDEPVGELSLNELKTMCDTNLLPYNFYEIEDKIEEREKVLNIMRKVKRR